MAYVINVNELPDAQYTPIKAGESLAMMAVVAKGVVILYTANNEALFVPWDEVVEYAATAEKKQPIKPAEPEPAKKKVRDAVLKPQ